MNDFILIGKCLGNLEIKQSESGNEYGQLLLSVKRPYKNKDGVVEEDIIQLIVFKNGLDEAKDVVSDGKCVVTKGHISCNNFSKEGRTYYSASIVADRISLFEDIC